MKHLQWFLSTTIVLVASSTYASQDKQTPTWMLGCWASEDGSSREVWEAQSQSQLIGFNVVINEGQVAFYEILSIEARPDETILYTAHPHGQQSAEFSTRSFQDTHVAFVNATHDYPQKIEYRLVDDQLIATISLLDGQNPTRFAKKRCKG